MASTTLRRDWAIRHLQPRPDAGFVPSHVERPEDVWPMTLDYGTKTAVPLASEVISDPLVLTEFTGPQGWIVYGGQVQINGGGWSAVDGDGLGLMPGDSVEFKHTSSASPLTATTTYFQINQTARNSSTGAFISVTAAA